MGVAVLAGANPTIAFRSKVVSMKGCNSGVIAGPRRPSPAGLQSKQLAFCTGATPFRPVLAVARPKKAALTTRAVLQTPPETSESEAGDVFEWERITSAGVKQATELWQAARRMKPRGEWAGKNPLKKVWFSDVLYSAKRNKFFDREWKKEDMIYGGFILAMHLVAATAPFCFSWANFNAFLVGWVITGMFGITLSYHRQLAHKSFKTPKWLEYVFAYCGVLAVQGDPLEWVSSHRYHHLHCDTPGDPHTPYEGFYHSHMGWFLDNTATDPRVNPRTNASDMQEQPFYVWLQKTYGLHVLASGLATFAIGGWGAFAWAYALRICWVHHITWFVNSACHVWGNQTYNTGDLSRNNWWVGVLAFGEGWHNNHHAFEFSCRHGLEWYQFDPTWYTIKTLEFFGLASNLKYPSEKKMASLAFKQ